MDRPRLIIQQGQGPPGKPPVVPALEQIVRLKLQTV